MIYIFRGSPASGKGTITAEFMKKITGRVAYIELDTFRWGFHLKNRSLPDIAEDEHELAYKNYLSVLENYLKNGTYTIVTEGLFSWGSPGSHGTMKDILELCKKYDYKTYPILLFADYSVLWDRNLKRKYSVPEDEFKMLYDYVMSQQADEEMKIDVGRSSVDEAVGKLCAYLYDANEDREKSGKTDRRQNGEEIDRAKVVSRKREYVASRQAEA